MVSRGVKVSGGAKKRSGCPVSGGQCVSEVSGGVAVPGEHVNVPRDSPGLFLHTSTERP